MQENMEWGNRGIIDKLRRQMLQTLGYGAITAREPDNRIRVLGTLQDPEHMVSPVRSSGGAAVKLRKQPRVQDLNQGNNARSSFWKDQQQPS
ncbi:hypothetical protein ACLKA7_016339 [Drosophila subpalustris]